MKDDRKLSLDELAEQVGIEKRTIRSYIQQGILRGPEAQGRYAHYSGHHLTRLKALRFLRQYEGRSLDEIRSLLLGATEADVEDLAARYDQMAASQSGLVTGSSSASSALDYIRSLKLSAPAEPAKPRSAAKFSRRKAADEEDFLADFVTSERDPKAAPRSAATPIDELLAAFEKLTADRPAPQRAKGEAWIVIRVTPDFELRVRGVNSADQLARLERIADHLREALLGGLKDDQHDPHHDSHTDDE